MSDPPLSSTAPSGPLARLRQLPKWAWFVTGAALILLILVALAAPMLRPRDPLAQPTVVLLSADGHALARRGAYKDVPVRVEDLPPYVPQAFVAIEDRRFYRHMGVDLRGVGRAAVTNSRAGEVVQGGSTITQQLAKNAFLDSRRTLGRKLNEVAIALWLELRMSKDDILSAYLSSVYFGDGVYGLRAAASHYFDKSPEKLTLGEAAMLAGLIKAPSRLNPLADAAASGRRARLVLQAMQDQGYITPEQSRRAGRVRVVRQQSQTPVGAYFADWVSASAEAHAPRRLGESTVSTTLDYRMQQAAEQAVAQIVPRRGTMDAALVAMTPDGAIKAMVGGRSYARSQFNRATSAKRQPGSTFKLFVYLAALRRGYTPDDRVENTPVRVGAWRPENFGGQYGPPLTLREAFAQSSNVAAVRLSRDVGVNAVAEAAHDLGVTSRLASTPAMALGASETTLLEMTAAYAAVAYGRGPVRPYGVVAARRAPSKPLPAATRAQLLDLLGAVTQDGTGRAARRLTPTFGKTGTSQDHRDALFIGFIDGLVVGVWVGRDDNKPMAQVTGGGVPVQIWNSFLDKIGAPARAPVPKPPPQIAPPEEEMFGWPGENGWIDEAPPPDFDPRFQRPPQPDFEPPPEAPDEPYPDPYYDDAPGY